MTYFLLKWVFNAIKRESANDDPKLKGRPFTPKPDLIKQLSKNPELLSALHYASAEDLSEGVRRNAGGVKEGVLLWEEFLDFFFLRQAKLEQRLDSNHWWRHINEAPPSARKSSDQDAEAPAAK